MPRLGSGARGLAPASLMHTAGQCVPYGLLEKWRQRDWKLLLLLPKLLPPAPDCLAGWPFLVWHHHVAGSGMRETLGVGYGTPGSHAKPAGSLSPSGIQQHLRGPSNDLEQGLTHPPCGGLLGLWPGCPDM